MKGKLILKDGTVFHGNFLFPINDTVGEVVFNTSMSGYQEVFTDPSYAGQIIAMTYPQIGNYGIMPEQSEAQVLTVKGILLHEIYDGPIHPKAVSSLKSFLQTHQIPTLTGIDTRALTKHIRAEGTIAGIITSNDLTRDEVQKHFDHFSMKDIAKKSSVKTIVPSSGMNLKHVLLMDFGFKKSIYQELEKRGAKVTIIPFNTSFDEIKNLNPDAIVLSNGPGNPEDLIDVLPTIKNIIDDFPTFGICLGHQLIALASGAKTYKMNFGHRGGNHSVKDLKNGRVFLSAQNHSYAVDPQSLKPTFLKPRFINVNDNSIEGLEHTRKPVFSVQFHPEANAGPEDSSYLFDEFFKLFNPESEI